MTVRDDRKIPLMGLIMKDEVKKSGTICVGEGVEIVRIRSVREERWIAREGESELN